MTKEEFQEYYKKNKMVVVGIPFIVAFLLINQFVLKPMFLKERLAANPGTPATGAAPPGIAAVTGAEGTLTGAVLAPPPPLTINLSTIPLLNKRVESRFSVNPSYPYDGSRSVFGGPQKPPPTPEPVAEYQSEIATSVARPNITYHGFYNIGPDRIAIVRLGERLILARAGQQLADSAFVLDVILQNKILIRDTEHQDSPFEVDLAEAQGLGKVDANGVPILSAKPGK